MDLTESSNSSAAARPQRGESRTANGSVLQSVRSVARSWSMQTFFESLCSGVVPTGQKKHITIFTYDDTSRESILKQLRNTLGKNIQTLQDNSYFQIIRTENQCSKDKHLLEHWFKRQIL